MLNKKVFLPLLLFFNPLFVSSQKITDYFYPFCKKGIISNLEFIMDLNDPIYSKPNFNFYQRLTKTYLKEGLYAFEVELREGGETFKNYYFVNKEFTEIYLYATTMPEKKDGVAKFRELPTPELAIFLPNSKNCPKGYTVSKESISTKYGSYTNCLRFHYDREGPAESDVGGFDIYYAENIGFVKSIDYDGGSVHTYELVDNISQFSFKRSKHK